MFLFAKFRFRRFIDVLRNVNSVYFNNTLLMNSESVPYEISLGLSFLVRYKICGACLRANPKRSFGRLESSTAVEFRLVYIMSAIFEKIAKN